MPEPETVALQDWLRPTSGNPSASSELARVEVVRAARRVGSGAAERARALIAELDLLPLDRATQDLACEVAPTALRSGDALHLATALLLGVDLTAFVAYDPRLVGAARSAGLAVVAPGQRPSA